MRVIRPKYSRCIAISLLVVMGYYLMPEFYLHAFHQHRHDPKFCQNAAECSGDSLSGEPLHCPQKEDYKQVYDNEYRYYAVCPIVAIFYFNELVVSKSVVSDFANTQPRAPPNYPT